MKQIIVDREKRIARCVINPLGQAIQNSIFEKLRGGQFIAGRQFGQQKILITENQPIDAQQLKSSLVVVPPTRFELVFQA